MKFKTVILLILIAASCLSFGRDYPVFRDSHGLINTDVAAKLGIETEDKLMRMAVNDFEGMLKSGLIIRERCDLFQINDHVDFCDYLCGFWDTSYAEYRPGSDRAKREIEANEKESRAWANVLSSMKLHDEMLSFPGYDKESGIATIYDFLFELADARTVRDLSPKVRLLLPERVAAVKKYLKSH